MGEKLSEFEGFKPIKLAKSHYTPDLGLAVCELIASGLTIRKVAEELGVHQSTIYLWASQNETFANMMIRARQMQAHVLMDKAYEEMEAHIERGEAKDGRQAVEGYVRIAEKLHPLKYGVRHVEYKGEIETKMGEEERNLRILELLAKTNPELIAKHVPEQITASTESYRLLENLESGGSEESSDESETGCEDYSEAS
jgi:transposase